MNSLRSLVYSKLINHQPVIIEQYRFDCDNNARLLLYLPVHQSMSVHALPASVVGVIETEQAPPS